MLKETGLLLFYIYSKHFLTLFLVDKLLFDVLFPQRLLASMCVSIYISLMISLSVVANSHQILEHYYLPIINFFQPEDNLWDVIKSTLNVGCYIIAFLPFAIILFLCCLTIYSYRSKVCTLSYSYYIYIIFIYLY